MCRHASRCAIVAFLLLMAAGAPVALGATLGDVHQASFAVLKDAVEKKKDHLDGICSFVAEKALTFSRDPLVLDFFSLARTYHDMTVSGSAQPEVRQVFTKVRDRFLDHYFTSYSMFYDAMLVDCAGTVFHTVKHEDDLGQNLFTGALAGSSLSRMLKQKDRIGFVDFQYFDISNEPAAFFVEPVTSDGTFQGWFILQWAINKLNSLFSGTGGLGRTGEIILVNREQYMLTDSRFRPESSALSLRLNGENITRKFREKKGSTLVNDYRDQRVLSHFAVFNFLGADWLISAKIDESEVITNYYRENRTTVLTALLERDFFYPAAMQQPTVAGDGAVRVDMEEFVRGGPGAVLCTGGVKTCTALIVAKPGEFAYMAHLSPYDRVYGGKMYMTDLSRQVLARIPQYEICRNDYAEVRFYIVAPHNASVAALVDRILQEGFLLSQISFMRNPDAESATVYYDVGHDEVNVWWHVTGSDAIVLQTGGAGTSLEEQVKAILF